MHHATTVLAIFAVLLPGSPLRAQYDIETNLPTCATLNWSASVHRSYPDIAQICQGVYQKDSKLYAKAEIEVIRVTGNRITIRSRHVDGSSGHQASMRVGPDWRATIEGKQLSVGELVPGQVLTVYIPEDRFVLTLEGDTDGAEIVTDDKAPAEQSD
jgi:hypothetical protein